MSNPSSPKQYKKVSSSSKQSILTKELSKSSESVNGNDTNTETKKQTPSSDDTQQTNKQDNGNGTEETSSDTTIVTADGATGVASGTAFADPNNFSIKHPLHNKWTMWWDSPRKKASQESWSANLNKLCDFDTVEDFWRLYNNIVTASNLQHGSNYHLFKTGIEPKWEDKNNEKGGKWVITFTSKQRGKLDEYWLFTLLAIIGESFGEYENDICGAVVSIRKGNDRLALWTRNAADEASCMSIGKVFKATLGLPDSITLGYQAHSDALRRNSSFNNKPRFEI